MYTVIAPLGERVGRGTFDTIYDNHKYKSVAKAIHNNDYVVVDFVQDGQGTIYFEAWYVKTPEAKAYQRLEIQHFPFGIDMIDDQRGFELGINVLKAATNEQDGTDAD